MGQPADPQHTSIDRLTLVFVQISTPSGPTVGLLGLEGFTQTGELNPGDPFGAEDVDHVDHDYLSFLREGTWPGWWGHPRSRPTHPKMRHHLRREHRCTRRSRSPRTASPPSGSRWDRWGEGAQPRRVRAGPLRTHRSGRSG